MSTTANFSTTRDEHRTLVVIFLRGAADGLTLVAPIADDNYHKFRPRLAVKPQDAVKLDDIFGFHPHLRALEPAWKDGDLVIAHSVGGESDSRSHFEAQDLMEHGGVAAGGWLGRFLRARGDALSPLSAVALAPTLPESLSGAPSAAAMQSIEDFAIAENRGGSANPAFLQELQRLYAREPGALHTAATSTFEALRRIEAIDLKATPANGAEYEKSDSFAQGLRQVAQLIRADVGLDVASVDLGGWDSHFTQKTLIEPLMLKLANGLAAFRRDLGPRMATTTVVVMTEFGRRVAENSAFGTDHGRGSTMFVMGGGVKGGGHVLGGWSGLKPEMLEGPGDLPVLNNYRNLLAPVLARHGAADGLDKIFPDFPLAPLKLYA